jgi:hypothetical protein
MLEGQLLCREALDLAAYLGQARLHEEDVVDRRRAVHDALQRGLR